MVRKAEADAKEHPWCCARADDDGLDEAKDVQCEAIDACVAQSVEHFVGNEEVTGSSPVAGSIHHLLRSKHILVFRCAMRS